MKKRYIFLIIGILFILLVAYLIYKNYWANYYSLSHINDFEKSKENFVINDTINIKTNKLNEEEYLVFKNIKLKNDFKDWDVKYSSDGMEIKLDDEFIWYTLNGNEALIGIAKGQTLFDLYKNGDIISSDERTNISSNLTKFFKKNKITNDIELLKYIEKTKNDKISILDPISDMKNFYDIHSLIRGTYINVDGINLINGDYDGYCFTYNFDTLLIKECNIINDNKRYTLTFYNLNYFTDEKIQNLLNTVIID